MKQLIIKDLHVEIEGKKILKGVNLTIKSGEIHAIMGPNGTGKSTLAAVIMGDQKYTVTAGEIHLDSENILELEVDQRARLGLFLAMQYPAAISGITNSDFIRSAISAQGKNDESLIKYIRRLENNIGELKMQRDMANRYLNEGFSGGEKKRNEILQMKMLKPNFAILDEIDSGLDIDALTVVGQNLTEEISNRSSELGLLMITHYQRLLDYIHPTHVHVMLDGRIVESGDANLAKKLETDGYEKLKDKYGITEIEEEENKRVSIGSCATAVGVGASNEKS